MRIRFTLLIVLCFLSSSIVLGQSSSDKNTQPKIIKTTKIDEFGDISEKEFSHKLNFFAERLRESEQYVGYIIFYNNFNSTPFRKTQYFARAKTHTYSTYLRGCYIATRILYMSGGLREKMTTELWIVPAGAESPKPTNSLDYAQNEKYKLEKLETMHVPIEAFRVNPIIEEENTEDEEKYSVAEKLMLDEFNSNPNEFYEYLSNELGEILNRDKTWRAKIFFYADKDEYDIKKSQQKIKDQLQTNFNKIGANLNQVEIMFGGYRSYPQIETWIIPQNGIEPEVMPNEKIEEN